MSLALLLELFFLLSLLLQLQEAARLNVIAPWAGSDRAGLAFGASVSFNERLKDGRRLKAHWVETASGRY